MIKNKYEMSQNYILNLENEELRERIKKLISDYKELKQKYDQIEKKGNVVQDEGNNAIIQE